MDPDADFRARQAAYAAYIHSAAWQFMRANVLAERGHTCERCGRSGRMEVHHKTYERFGGQEQPDDLEVLCRACHRAHHGKGTLKERRTVKQRQREYRRQKPKRIASEKKIEKRRQAALRRLAHQRWNAVEPRAVNANGEYEHLVQRSEPASTDYRASYLDELRQSRRRA